MRRRKHKRQQQEDVQLNLAAMLDMAFQLLAFFIMTFKPPPVEGQIMLMLPPPVPIAPDKPVEDKDTDNDAPGVQAAKTLTITIQSAGNGQTASVTVGMAKLFDGALDGSKLAMFDRQLKQVFAIEGTPFDQVLLRVGKSLNYGELMKLIDVCTRQKMADGKKVTKISFIELQEK